MGGSRRARAPTAGQGKFAPAAVGTSSPAPSVAKSSGSSSKDSMRSDNSNAKRRTCLQAQLHKTKLCTYYLRGACQYGHACAFAHTVTELQAAPDLSKTRLCTVYAAGHPCFDKDCTFAHGEQELRSTDLFFKKTLCIWNEKGKCRNGDQCRFAHGAVELREHLKDFVQDDMLDLGQASFEAGPTMAPPREPMKIEPARTFVGSGLTDVPWPQTVELDRGALKSDFERSLRDEISALALLLSAEKLNQMCYPEVAGPRLEGSGVYGGAPWQMEAASLRQHYRV